MNISYDAYKIFYVVALSGSISKGAEELMISQPAVSWQIRTLEGQLGLTLFVRTKRGVSLTDEGKILFDYIKQGIESFTNAENELTNLKNMDYGTIRIGASTTVSQHVLMPYLEIFHRQYPNIEIEIVNTLTKTLIDELNKGNLDILVLNLPTYESENLKVQPIMEVHDTFAGNKQYYQKTGGKLSLTELENYPLIFQKRPSNTRNFLDNYLKTNGKIIKPKMEVVSYNLIMDLVKIGFGIGYATREFIKDELARQELFEIEVIPTLPPRHIGIVTLKNKVPNYSTKKLIKLMTNKN